MSVWIAAILCWSWPLNSVQRVETRRADALFLLTIDGVAGQSELVEGAASTRANERLAEEPTHSGSLKVPPGEWRRRRQEATGAQHPRQRTDTCGRFQAITLANTAEKRGPPKNKAKTLVSRPSARRPEDRGSRIRLGLFQATVGALPPGLVASVRLRAGAAGPRT